MSPTGGTRPEDSSATLDGDVRGLLAKLSAQPSQTRSPDSADGLRRDFNAMFALLHPGEPQEFAGSIEDVSIPVEGRTIRARCYRPDGSDPGAAALIYAHGGGWVAGDLDSCDPHVRRTAEMLGTTVVSVEYSKAPEHPFPAALMDVTAAHEWVIDRWNPSWVGVSGDSSGGNLAAAAAIVAAQRGTRCDAQLLFYPALDPRMSSESYRARAVGFMLEGDAMKWYWQCYLGAVASPDDPLVAPLQSDPAILSRVAPAVIATAGFDPLRDEGREYASRLSALGVRTVYLEQPTLIHGWLDHQDVVPAAVAAHKAAIRGFEQLVKELAPGSRANDNRMNGDPA